MSDQELDRQRGRRRTMIIADAAHLEYRAHQFIIEAHELRKLADSLMPIQTSNNMADEVRKISERSGT